MKSNKNEECRTLEVLLKDLEKPLKFLVTQIDIPCQSKDDAYQDFMLNVMEVYNKDPEYCSKRKLGWWFIKGRWFLQKKRRLALFKNPLANSMPLPDLSAQEYKDTSSAVIYGSIQTVLDKLMEKSAINNINNKEFEIQEDLKELLTKEQVTMVLQKLNGMYSIEIAKKLGVCPATITKRMKKVRKILRKYIEDGYN